jgi:hypothetical protein
VCSSAGTQELAGWVGKRKRSDVEPAAALVPVPKQKKQGMGPRDWGEPAHPRSQGGPAAPTRLNTRQKHKYNLRDHQVAAVQKQALLVAVAR